MLDRKLGGFISANPPAPTQASAQGVWDGNQQIVAQLQNAWPFPPDVVQRSLRFNSADSAFLNRTPAAIGSRTTWTWSAWVKRSKWSGLRSTLFRVNYNGSIPETAISFSETAQGNPESILFGTYPADLFLLTTPVFRDPSAWYHIVCTLDTTNGVSTDRARIYVNGTRITTFYSTPTYPGPSYAGGINSTDPHRLGGSGNANEYFDGYMAEVNFIDGQALTPSSFGETDPQTGIWVPKRYTGTYGNNGFRLPFSNNSSTTALGFDASGNGNNWTPNNFSVTPGSGNDSLLDVPSLYGTDTGLGGEVRGNYCALNPLKYSGVAPTITDGNLQSVISTDGSVFGTIAVSSGKWYWETVMTAGAVNLACFGIAGINTTQAYFANSGTDTGYGYSGTGVKTTNGTAVSYGSTFTVGDVIGVALDLDAGTIAFYKNGVSQGTAYTGISGTFYPAGANGNSSSTKTLVFNFGQRPFAYTAPTGFKALCTTNLPAPAIGQTSSNQARNYFEVITYIGNGSTQTITGLNFQPDFIWIKNRDANANHRLFDSVRGSSKVLYSSLTNAEDTDVNGLTAFTSNGFSIGSTQVNDNGQKFVAWCWNAGGTTVTNTSGTITSQVRANRAAGFSVVTYTGMGSAATIGHGLGAAPSMIIVKSRTSSVRQWPMYHAANRGTTGSINPQSSYIYLNLTNSAPSSPYSGFWNDTAPTSTLFSVGTDGGTNANTENFVAYCFAAVPYFSAFGSYTGNGSADGPFVYLGFRPRFVMLKRISTTGDWFMMDTSRSPNNVQDKVLYANFSNAEASYSFIDMNSNGFKLRTTDAGVNGSGNTIIYAAFAEAPFRLSSAR